MSTTSGGTAYAGTSEKTSISAGRYLTGNLKLYAMAQENLLSTNILRGKTISISNGSTNVWSVSGVNSVLKYITGKVTSGTSTRAFYLTTTTSQSCYVASVNPGFTPVIAIAMGSLTEYIHCMRTGATAIIARSKYDGTAATKIFNNNLSQNSAWKFTSTAVDFVAVESGDTATYYIFGY